MNRKAAWSILPILAVMGMAAYAQSTPFPQPLSAASAQKSIHYDRLPLSFEPNAGQTSRQVQWLSRGPEYTIFLSGPDAVLEVSKVVPAARPGVPSKLDTTALRMNLLGAAAASSSTGEEPQTGKVNYFTGTDQANWHRDISLYGRVRLHRVYPGIDLAYYGHQGQLEYDFIVAPGADASAIRLRFDGARAKLDGNGDLVLPVNESEIRFHPPVVYQQVDGQRRPVEGAFQMAKNGDVSFHLGAYDHSRELVIDPTLVYTGTFGTASENDAPAGMAVDSRGELLITGTTYDLNFPATSGAYQTSCGPVSATDTQNGVFRCATGDQPGAMSSAYVMKLSADGTQLIYATFLHGITGSEGGSAVKADASGNAVVLGTTSSADFPLVNAPAIPQLDLCKPSYPTDLYGNITGPAQQGCNGYYNGGGTEWTIQGTAGFVSKLSADGSSLLYSAFLSYRGSVYPQSLALDASGNMYILDTVNAADYPGQYAGEIFYPTTTTAFQQYGIGDIETGLTVLSADGQTILYSTIWGETAPIASGCGSCLNATIPEGLALGQNGTVFIAGETRNPTLPVTAGTVQTSCVETTPTQCYNNVGYVAAFNINGSGPSSLEWATFIGGPDNPNTAVSTQLNSIAADADNNVYLTGYTTDALFPITQGAYASTCPLDSRAGSNYCDNSPFVSKLNSTGTAYTWSTFIAPTQGAGSSATANAIALDAQNNVYVYGDSGALIIPAVNPLPQYPDDWYQPYPFLTVLNPTGSALLFSSQIAPDYYVSSMQNGMALDSSGNIYMVGNTQGGQVYMLGNTTLNSWPTTQGTYSTPQSGTGTIPFFAKVSAILAPTQTTLTAPTTAIAGQNVTFNVTVAGTTQSSPTPTGTVTLTNTATNPATTLTTIDLGAGSGSFTTSSLGPGSYTIVASYSGDSVYDVSTSSPANLSINNTATATITLGNLTQTYTGSPLSASATTVPANLPVTITYNGSSTPPTGVGNYSVVATIASGQNYTGTVTGTLVISPATATITLGNLAQTYTGSPLSASATTVPANLPVTLTYNGSSTPPTAMGNYSVSAAIASGQNYTGTATGTLVISSATATITLGNLAQTYTGSPLSVSVTTKPANLPVTLTYNGSATPPTNGGNYSVSAVIASGQNYTGTATGTLVISPASQTITFPAIATQTVGASLSLAATSTSGLTVGFASTTPTVCSVTGTTAKMLATGNCTVQASQTGNSNFAPAPFVNQTFGVSSASTSTIRLTALPNAETIRRGDLAAFVLEAQSVNGFSGSVKISCSGGPSNSVCADFPQTLQILPNKTALAISGILFPKNTTPGAYTLTFTGTSGAVTVSTTAQFTVQQ